MYSKSGYIEIMINEKSSEDIGNFFNHFFPDTKFDWKHQ